MPYVIKNITDKPLEIDGVSIDPKEQLSIVFPSQAMRDAQTAGKLQIKDSSETFEERKADVDGYKYPK
jgi:hypothetical protein